MEQVEIIGLIAGVIGVLGWYPQVKRIWIDKKADGVSVPSFAAITISLFLWLAYGLIKNSIAIVVANILALIVIIAIAFGAYRLQSIN
jgi:MtN3 and saliva related transmembrane protein